MTSPESDPNQPNVTEAFNRLFHFSEHIDKATQDALLNAITDDPERAALLQQELQRGYSVEEAMGRVIMATNPEEGGWHDDVVALVADIGAIQAADDIQTTGVGIEAYGGGAQDIRINDTAVFARALQKVQLPEDPEEAEELKRDLGVVVSEALRDAAIATEYADPEGFRALAGDTAPPILLEGDLSPEGISRAREERNLGRQAIDELARNADELQKGITHVGLGTNLSEAVGLLHKAVSTGEVPIAAWAAAEDACLFDNSKPGEERLVEPEHWEAVERLFKYLDKHAPNADFTYRLRKLVLTDTDRELNKPFNPDEGDPVYRHELGAHDFNPHEFVESPPPPEGYEAFEMDLDMAAAGINFQLDDELASPEEARAFRTAYHEQIVTSLKSAARRLRAALPYRPPQAQPASTASSATSIRSVYEAVHRTSDHLYDIHELTLTGYERFAAAAGALAVHGGETAPEAVQHALRTVQQSLKALEAGLGRINETRSHLDDYTPGQ